MVIIKEDNLPSMRWPLSRVVKTIPGPDGLVRVADIRTATNTNRRPIHRLAPFPIEEDNNKPSEAVQSTQTSEAEQSTEPAKRRRLSIPSSQAMIIAIMIMLPICFASSITIKPFTTNPGIYYEKIGTAGNTASEWTLVSYVDMQSYCKKYELMLKYPAAQSIKYYESHHRKIG